MIASRRALGPRRVVAGRQAVLELPWRSPPTEPADAAAGRAAATVVVCEDDAPTLELLCDHLEADRFRALPAPSAADALRLCHFKQPDLLLLDLRLPDASGLDVLREIRASEGAIGSYDPLLPVIVLSGRGTAADRLRGLAEGADDYVPKPFDYQRGLGADRRRAASARRAPRSDRGWSAICSSTRDPRGPRRRAAGAARGQGVRAALRARGRAAPRVHQAGAASRRLGASNRSVTLGRSTRTRAGCGESSTPRRPGTS